MSSKNFSIQRVRSVPTAARTSSSVIREKVATQSIDGDPFEFNEFSPPKQIANKVDARKPAREKVNDGEFTRSTAESASCSKNHLVLGLGTKSKSASAIPSRTDITSNSSSSREALTMSEARPKVITVARSDRPVQATSTASLTSSQSVSQTDVARSTVHTVKATVRPVIRCTSGARSSTTDLVAPSRSQSVLSQGSASASTSANTNRKPPELGSSKPKAQSQPESCYSDFDFDSQVSRPRIVAVPSTTASRSEPPPKRRAVPFRIDAKLFDDQVEECDAIETPPETQTKTDEGASEAFLFTDDFDSGADNDFLGSASTSYESGSSSKVVNTKDRAALNSGVTKPKGSFDFPDDDAPAKPQRFCGAIVPTSQQGNGAIKVKRGDRPLYTVVRGVQDAQLCEESGEAQSFVDDVEYLLDGLDASQSASTRSLTMTKLAERACQSEFRRSLRAHCFLPRIVSMLVPGLDNGSAVEMCNMPIWLKEDVSLALSSACFLFVLSCDRLNVELNVPLVRLFAALSCATDAKTYTPAEQRTAKRVRELLEQAGGSFFHSFLPDELNACNLSLDALLNWIARKDHLEDDWLKRELRASGVIDRVAALLVADCAYFGDTLTCQFNRYISADAEANSKRHALEQTIRQRLRRTERCLRLFQLVTYMNRINQDHLAAFRDGELLRGVAHVISLCSLYVAEFGDQLSARSDDTDDDEHARADTDGDVLLVTDTLLSAIQAVLNLTHSNVRCAVLIGQQDGFVQSVVGCACLVSSLIARDEKAFELRLLALGLLVNLVEQSGENEAALLAPTALPFRNAKLARIVRKAVQKQRSATSSSSSSSLSSSSSRSWTLFDESLARDNLDLLVTLLVEADSLMRTHETEVEQVTDELIRDAEQHASQRAPVDSHAQSQATSSSSQRPETSSDNANANEEGPTNGQSGQSSSRSPTKQRGGVTTRLINNKQFIDQAVRKAGRHMEYSMIVAYIALSLGRLLSSHVDASFRIRRRLPNSSFDSVIATLFQFQQFMELTFPNSAGSSSVSQVIDLYRQHNE